MSTGYIENNLKGGLASSDFNIYSNKNICPFTLETIVDCKVRNSFFDKQLCFFMLEPCYFSKQDKFKKIACGR